MTKITSIILSAFLLLATYTTAKAQTDIKSKFSLKNVQIISASKKQESAFEAASSVYVLTSEDIQRIGATTIPEALRVVPGVEVAKMNANTWAVSIRGFNGQFANKLLVLVDGQSVYTPTFSGTWWDSNDVPLIEDIDRIEVIKGPGATVWGANAVNGVINIISKNSKLTQGTHVLLGTGTDEKAMAEVRHGGKIGKNTSYRIFAKKYLREGQAATSSSITDTWETEQGGFRFDIEPSKREKIFIKGDFYNDITNSTLTPPSLAPRMDQMEARGARILSKYESIVSDDSDFFVQAYLDYNNRRTPFLKIERTILDLEAQYNYSGFDRHQISAGVEVRHHDDKLRTIPIGGVSLLSYTPEEDEYTSVSAFIQDKFEIIDSKLFLTIGSKFEYNYYTDLEIQPNIRLSYLPSRNATLWAAVSRASRTPTRGEHGLTLVAPQNVSVKQFGNTKFDSEKVTTFEAGLRFRPRNNIIVDITGFYNDYKDLRSFEQGITPIPFPPFGIPFFTADNNLEGKSFGGEISVDWTITPNWDLVLAYDFFKLDLKRANGSNDTIEMAQEDASPENKFTLRSHLNLGNNWELDNILYYYDSYVLGSSTKTFVDDYWRFDTKIAWRANKNLEFSLVGQDLFGNGRVEYTPALYQLPAEVERSVYTQVKLKF